MPEKLSKIIKEIENKGGISGCYLHRNYDTGHLELNIEFNNDIADEILEKSGIVEINACAYWE